jgi:hypothetical protein
MGSYTANLPTLTIDSGFASSSVLTGLEDASALILMAGTLTGTLTIRVAPEVTSATASGTWSDYQSGGSDVTIGSGNSAQLTPPLGGSMILVSSTSEAALRSITVQKRFSVGGG